MREELGEIFNGIRQFELWSTFAWNDIKARYARSILGPIWMVLSMGFMVASLGLVYGAIFGVELSSYFPYLTMGFISWGLISSFFLEGSNIFVEVASLIKQIKIPLSVHVARMSMRVMVVFFHNMLIFVFVAVYFSHNPGVNAFLLIPALFLSVLNGTWIIMLLGGLSVRFRDLPYAIASILQLAFFLTPIIWQPSMLSGRGRFFLTDANPLYHAVEIIRSPMLGQAPAMLSWYVMGSAAVVGWFVTLLFLKYWRKQIPFWV